MENISQPAKAFTNIRKAFLIAGIITLAISVAVIFPIESSKTYFLEELPYTFLTLAIALLLGMFGLLGNNFFKGLLLLFVSSIVGFILFYFAFPVIRGSAFISIWLGIPSGIIAALVFMVANYYFLRAAKSYRLLKQIIVYSIILLIVAILFGYGGDWIYDITEYFKRDD
ncbi:hypothetical protein [Pedobacter metabolipauper]|uniref:Uncharacterized protein n=1 Tax=Pedobacter metabolipauper TaxID=425513 RepID=A0A4V6PW02_9SPHI|nr:hypothetical protein [Pedobacter metabolipauper]TDQ08294.1 hypothetical protein ATK78_2803 [Pedobacter metabolipauper]